MLAPELVTQIADLELTARRALAGLISGDNQTKKRGTGFEFDTLRDYAPGDDLRYIDWKSTARAQKMLTRQYLEDRQKTVILLVDVSPSIDYGSHNILKSEYIKQVAGLMAFITLYQKDAVGVILFSDHVEQIIKPGRGRAHVLKIVTMLFTHVAQGQKTDINKALQAALHIQKKEACILLISDLCDKLNTHLVSLCKSKHELFVFRCVDRVETNFPKAGILTMQDRETGDLVTINTDLLGKQVASMHNNQDETLKKMGIAYSNLQTHMPLLTQATRFLKKIVRKK